MALRGTTPTGNLVSQTTLSSVRIVAPCGGGTPHAHGSMRLVHRALVPCAVDPRRRRPRRRQHIRLPAQRAPVDAIVEAAQEGIILAHPEDMPHLVQHIRLAHVFQPVQYSHLIAARSRIPHAAAIIRSVDGAGAAMHAAIVRVAPPPRPRRRRPRPRHSFTYQTSARGRLGAQRARLSAAISQASTAPRRTPLCGPPSLKSPMCGSARLTL